MTVRQLVARNSDFEDTKDFIPTPPYATRAFYEYVAPEVKRAAPGMSAWDPAAGQGHMLKVFEEYRHQKIEGSDLHDHGGLTMVDDLFIERGTDFLDCTQRSDLILTNPPYALLNDFIEHGLLRADHCLALLVRVQALEGQQRYKRIFSKTPPTRMAFFSDRIPFKVGKVVRKAPKMYFHVWLYWNTEYIRKGRHQPEPPMWIPPNAQQLLEKDSDYEQP